MPVASGCLGNLTEWFAFDEPRAGVCLRHLAYAEQSYNQGRPKRSEMCASISRLCLLQAGVGFIPFGGLAFGGYKLLTRDDTSPVLAAAALMLAKDPDPKSGKALADASANKDKWLVRAAAFDAIAKRGDLVLLDAAAAGLQDDKNLVRISAAAAVIRLHDIQSQPKPEPKKSASKKPKK